MLGFKIYFFSINSDISLLYRVNYIGLAIKKSEFSRQFEGFALMHYGFFGPKRKKTRSCILYLVNKLF
jgi:hypothetical protein